MAAHGNKAKLLCPMTLSWGQNVSSLHVSPKMYYISCFNLSLPYSLLMRVILKQQKCNKMSHNAFAKMRLVIRVGHQELLLILESIPNCVIPESHLAVTVTVIDSCPLQ